VTTLLSVAPALASAGAAILAVLGLLFIVTPLRAFGLSGHVTAALPGVMGGRYIGLGAIIAGLLAMGDDKALSLAFAIGAGFGFLDAVLVRGHSGRMTPHLAAGIASAVLSAAFATRAGLMAA
jgi:hypothetical protein